MKDVLTTLKEARILLSTPKAWTINCLARNAREQAVSPEDETSVCWCAAGALYKVNPGLDGAALAAWNVLDRTAFEIHGLSVATFNDAQKSVEPVLELFDRAIAKWASE